MAGKSTVLRDPVVRTAVNDALAAGATLDQIAEKIRELGSDVSRSAIGRYALNYRKIADRQRDMAAVANSFAGDFGRDGDSQSRLLIQLATTMLTRHAFQQAASEQEDDDEALPVKSLADFARAVKDITSASKTDADRDAKVRDEARKQAKLDAAKEAESGARAAGASEETIRAIKLRILGMAS